MKSSLFFLTLVVATIAGISARDDFIEQRSLIGDKKDNDRPLFVVVKDNERKDSFESRRPIIVKQRHNVFRPVPIIQPVFIEHAYHHTTKRRPQFHSEEWSSESKKITTRRKTNPKKEKPAEDEKTEQKHHYHYMPYPKAKPFRRSAPVDCSKWDVTTTSRQSEIMTFVMKIIVNIAEAASPSL